MWLTFIRLRWRSWFVTALQLQLHDVLTMLVGYGGQGGGQWGPSGGQGGGYQGQGGYGGQRQGYGDQQQQQGGGGGGQW